MVTTSSLTLSPLHWAKTTTRRMIDHGRGLKHKRSGNHACTSMPHKSTHTQPFYGSMDFVQGNPGEPVPEQTFTHSHLSWSSIVPICFIHLIRSMASSLFNPCAWQSTNLRLCSRLFHCRLPTDAGTRSATVPLATSFALSVSTIRWYSSLDVQWTSVSCNCASVDSSYTHIMVTTSSLTLSPLHWAKTTTRRMIDHGRGLKHTIYIYITTFNSWPTFFPISAIQSAVGKRLITHCCVSPLACSRLSGHIEPHSPRLQAWNQHNYDGHELS